MRMHVEMEMCVWQQQGAMGEAVGQGRGRGGGGGGASVAELGGWCGAEGPDMSPQTGLNERLLPVQALEDRFRFL